MEPAAGMAADVIARVDVPSRRPCTASTVDVCGVPGPGADGRAGTPDPLTRDQTQKCPNSGVSRTLCVFSAPETRSAPHATECGRPRPTRLRHAAAPTAWWSGAAQDDPTRG